MYNSQKSALEIPKVNKIAIDIIVTEGTTLTSSDKMGIYNLCIHASSSFKITNLQDNEGNPLVKIADITIYGVNSTEVFQEIRDSGLELAGDSDLV